MYSYVVAVFSSIVVILIGTASATCLINLETPLGSRTPLVLTLHGHFIKPNNPRGDLLFEDNYQMQFTCTGPRNYLIDTTIGPQANATCRNNGFILDANSQRYTFDQLQCRQPPQSAAKEVGTCNGGAKKIQMGFQINPARFTAKIEVCFDATTRTTYWSRHVLHTSPYSCQTGDTTSFKKDFFGNVDPDTIYTNNPNYDRGHLTPKCDYLIGPEKRMTYYYVNAAPQVSDFNQKNWKSLEGIIRTNANQNNKLLNIYTGTHDTAGSLGGVLPVPKYFWKVVIDRSSGNGVAFIGVNNVVSDVPSPCPSSTTCGRFQRLLASVSCRNLLWLGQSFLAKVNDIAKGKIYCCEIPLFRNIPNIQIPAFPEFTGGLLVHF